MIQIAEEAGALEITRRFSASPEKVFDAWLSPLWAKWLPPRDMCCELVVMEPRVGGRYLARMSMTDGRCVDVQGEYLEISPPHRLVLTWRVASQPEDTRIVVDVRADGDGAIMTLRHDGLRDPDVLARHEVGWAGPRGSLEKLAEFLSVEA